MKNLLLLVAISLVLFTCEAPVKNILIDNPSDKEITIEIGDDPVIKIGPHQSKEVEIKFGKRNISVNGGEAEKIHLDKEKDYLLNPLKETYYIQYAKFFTSDKIMKEYFKYNDDKSDFEGMEIGGDYRKIANKILIEKSWKFGLDSPITNEIGIRAKKAKDFYTLKKIHRKVDLEKIIMDSFMNALQEQALDKE